MGGGRCAFSDVTRTAEGCASDSGTFSEYAGPVYRDHGGCGARSLIRTPWVASSRVIRRADHLLSRRSRSIRSTTSGGVWVSEDRGTLGRSCSPASPCVSYRFFHLGRQPRETPA